MRITEQLSSQVGDRTEAANRAAAEICLDNPALLDDIAAALTGKDAALLGDCAEVLTKVAERRAELVAPYYDALLPLLSHRTTRVRWEAMHAIALVTPVAPGRMAALLPVIAERIRSDASTIVRDYAIDAAAASAQASAAAAEQACGLLQEALLAWDGKHAARVLSGLARVVAHAPALALRLLPIGREYAEHGKPAVKKAAKALVKAAGASS